MANLFNIKDYVVVITGGTGVLGRTIAKYLALEGAKVIIGGRKEDVGKKIVDDITSTGIASITTDDEDDQIFDIKGNRIDNLQHGLNIIKKKNGQVVKILK